MQQSQVVMKARSDVLSQTQDEHTMMKKTLIQMEEQLRQKDNTIRYAISCDAQTHDCVRICSSLFTRSPKKAVIPQFVDFKHLNVYFRSIEKINRDETSDQIKRLHGEIQSIKSDLR